MEHVEWTEALCLQLIREYRERPALWDREHFLFYKKNMKMEIWAELGKAMNIAPEICRHKISPIMDKFRREKAKFEKSLKSGTCYKSSWFAFEAMSFLLVREQRKRKLMVTQNTGEDDVCLKNEDEVKQSIALSEPEANDILQWAATPAKKTKIKSMTVPEPNANDILQRAATSAKKTKIKSMTVPEPDANDILQWAAIPAKTSTTKSMTVPELDAKDILERAATSSKKARISVRYDLYRKSPKPEERLPASPPKDCIASQLDDEINNFSKFIASKMKNYSTKTKNAVQQEIWKVINKADQNFYEKQKPQQYNKPRERKKSSRNVCKQPRSSDGSKKFYNYSDSD